MSTTSYNTNAKPRGRRDDNHGSSGEKQSSSRTSSHTSQRLSKTTSRPLEERTIPRSRPDTPALFWQRNKAADPSRPNDSVIMSPRASTASTKSDPSDDTFPVPVSPTQSNRSLGSKRSTESTSAPKAPAEPILSHKNSTETKRLSSGAAAVPPDVPANAASETAERKASTGDKATKSIADMQPKVSNVSEEANVTVGSIIEQPQQASLDLPKATDLTEAKPEPKQQTQTQQQQYQYQPPQTSTPAISPPQSPRMHNHYPYGAPPGPFNYGYPIPVDSSNPYGFVPMQYPPPPSSSMPSPPPTMEPVQRLTSQGKEDHQQIMAKVAGVLPDINRLLEHYQETQGELSAKDLEVKQTQLQRSEEIAKLRLELEASREEYDKLIGKLVGEAYKYKSDIQEKDAIIAKLQAEPNDAATLKEELAVNRDKYAIAVSAVDTARLAQDEANAKKRKVERELEAARQKHIADIEELKKTHVSDIEFKTKEQEKVAVEHKTALNKLQMELAALLTKHAQQKKDLDGSRELHAASESKLSAAIKEHKDAILSHRQQLQAQMESLSSRHEKTLTALKGDHAIALADLTAKRDTEAAQIAAQHQRELDKTAQDLKSQKEAFEKLHTDHNEAVAQHVQCIGSMEKDLFSRKEAYEKLQNEHQRVSSKHDDLMSAVTSWKKRQDEFHAENEKFKSLLSGFASTTTAE